MKIKSIKLVQLDHDKQFYDVVECLPYHNFIIKTNNGEVVSHNCNFTDEVNFSAMTNDVEKMKKKQKQIISQIDARMKSRFLRGNYLPTLNIIASSKNSEQSFLEDYIEGKRRAESKTTLIIDEPQWVVDSRKVTDKWFYVAVGNKFLANELLPKDAPDLLVEEYRAKGYSMLKVPEAYYEGFQENLEGSLADIAGIAATSGLRYISGMRWNEVKVDDYVNPFVKDIIEVGTGDDVQYSEYFDIDKVPSALKAKPLFIHLDMSIGSGGKGDKTGIAGTYVLGKKPKVEGEDASKELYFQTAFAVSIKAPKGREISFDKHRTFIRWLREQGFNIKVITSDTFMAGPVRQQLIADGFTYETLSVDRLDTQTKQCLPYIYFKSVIYEKRLRIFRKCDLLTEEIIGLERESDGHINHMENGTMGCFTGDTKVSLVDGRELSFIELIHEFNEGKTNYVYSFNHTKNIIEPKKITNAQLTIKNAPLVEVILDNGDSIRCTPNHRFMLRDGTYCQAKDLEENQSLMPLYRKISSKGLKGYRLYYEPIEEAWHYEHRRFCTEVDDEKYLVHHKNCVISNNSPDNLIWCSKSRHQKIHAEMSTGSHSPEARKKRSESLRQYYKNNRDNPVFIERNRKVSDSLKNRIPKNIRDKNTQYKCIKSIIFLLKKEIAREKRVEIENRRKELENVFNVKYSELTPTEKNSLGVKFTRLKNPCIQEGITEKVKENHKQGKYKNAYSALQKCNEYRRQHGRSKEVIEKMKATRLAHGPYEMSDATRKKLSEATSKKRWYNNGEVSIYINPEKQPIPEGFVHGRLKTWKNHKVVSVKFLDTTEDVYDLTVEDNHNFALSAGVFVHNSKDLADAVCGSIYSASQHAEQFAYDYGENLDLFYDTNINNNSTDFINSSFEQELTNALLKNNNIMQDKKQDSNFLDFGMGKPVDYVSCDVLNGIIVF